MNPSGRTAGARAIHALLALSTTAAAAFVAVAGTAVPATAADVPTPVCDADTCTVTYPYVGEAQDFVVPAGVTDLDVTAVGAAGGAFADRAGVAGRGAVVEAALEVVPGDRYVVRVGETPVNFDGAFNGGGAAFGSKSGGGATDLRAVVDGESSLATRLAVAGGGGGADYTADGGDAGLVGSAGGAGGGTGGEGGTQTSGGAAGVQASGDPGTAGSLGQGGTGGLFGGGGGGGLYGGGGGGYFSGGGGGSSLVPDGGTVGVNTDGSAARLVISYEVVVPDRVEVSPDVTTTTVGTGVDYTVEAFLGDDSVGAVTAAATLTATPLDGGAADAVDCPDATCTLTTGGTYRVEAVVGGLSDTAGLTVARSGTSTAVTVTAGSITAEVAPDVAGLGAPSGSVRFLVDGAYVGGPVDLVDGAATYTGDTTRDRDSVVAAVYTGDATYEASSGSTARTNPTVTASYGEPGAGGWFDEEVTVTFSCTPGSGVVDDCPADVTLGEGAGQLVTRTVVADDGGADTVTVGPIDVDLTAPSVRLVGVRDGGRYPATLPQPRCVGSDALSGLASCDLTTTSLAGGATSVTATATDVAGSTAVATKTYVVHRRGVRFASLSSGSWGVPAGATRAVYALSTQRPVLRDASGARVATFTFVAKVGGEGRWIAGGAVTAPATPGEVRRYELTTSDGTAPLRVRAVGAAR